MGAESFVDAPNDGKRKARRARVLLAVKIGTPYGEVDGRLRDLSRKGALVECGTIPPVGAEVLFNRGTTSVPARVAWTSGNRVGLEFAFMIDESEVLVQLGKPAASHEPASPYSPGRFRRARLFGEDMSETEKNIARAWSRSVGISVPGE